LRNCGYTNAQRRSIFERYVVAEFEVDAFFGLDVFGESTVALVVGVAYI